MRIRGQSIRVSDSSNLSDVSLIGYVNNSESIFIIVEANLPIGITRVGTPVNYALTVVCVPVTSEPSSKERIRGSLDVYYV